MKLTLRMASPRDSSSNSTITSISNSSTPSLCSFCLRPIAITKAGVVRLHDPIRARCGGSGQLPATRNRSCGSGQLPATRNRSLRLNCPRIDSDQVSVSDQSVQEDESLSGSQTFVPVASVPACPLSIQPSRPSNKILPRIPKGAREQCGKKLATILDSVSRCNDHASWSHLLSFAGCCLRAPSQGGKRRSLAAVINAQIKHEDMSLSTRLITKSSSSKKPLSVDYLAAKVLAKLERDFKGAVRLACSEDTFAERSDVTYTVLREKHPAPPLDSSIPPPPTQARGLHISEPEIVKAILSFPCGSAGGSNGLRPQHLKDMIGPSGDGAANNLVRSLVVFAGLVLSAEVPVSIHPFFWAPASPP